MTIAGMCVAGMCVAGILTAGMVTLGQHTFPRRELSAGGGGFELDEGAGFG